MKEIQDTDNKAYHYYLESISLEDIALDQMKKEAALSPLAPFNERGNQPLLRGLGSGKGKTLSAVADFNSSQTPEETATTTNTIAQDTDAVNSEESENEEVKASYDKAANAARYAGRLSDEELKDRLFQTQYERDVYSKKA